MEISKDLQILFGLNNSFLTLNDKPTTLSGYGITDAFDGNYNNLINKPIIPTSLPWSSITETN